MVLTYIHNLRRLFLQSLLFYYEMFNQYHSHSPGVYVLPIIYPVFTVEFLLHARRWRLAHPMRFDRKTVTT